MNGLARLGGRIPFALRAYAAVWSVLFVVSALTIHLVPRNPGYPIQEPLRFAGASLLEGWARYDGGWYVSIARDGYSFVDLSQQASVAFFPAYPLLMRAVGLVIGDVTLAGIVVTIVCGATATWLLERWARSRFDVGVTRTAVVTMLVFPYAYYLYGAVYADALFLAAVIAAFVLLDRGHPAWAGLAGALATATRPVGIAVVVGLAAVLLQSRRVITLRDADRGRRPRVDLRGLRPGDAGVLLAAGGLAAWMLYLWRTWGDPLLFAKIEGASGWDQSLGRRTLLKVSWLEHLRDLPATVAAWSNHGNDIVSTLTTTLQAALVAGFLVAVFWVWRQVGWGYAVYVVALLALPVLGTKDWQGTGRYLLAAFPVFVVLGGALHARTGLRWAWWGVSAALLVLATSAFAQGFYLA